MGLNAAGLTASGGGSGGGGGSGTVTSVSVVSANGLAGTVANSTTTPAITLSTTITGILKGNGTAISAAVAGTDYLSPTGSGAGLTGIVVTFNGRSGAVTLSAADVEGTFTAKGQLFAGTGSGTGDLVSTGTAGQVLTVGGADASGLEWATPGAASTTFPWTAESSAFTAVSGNSYAITTGATNLLVTLPAHSNGAFFFFKKVDSGIGAVTFSANIDGTAQAISVQYDSFMVGDDGTNFWIM